MTSEKVTSKLVQQLEEQASEGRPTCLILARKGSKRLKNKNMLLLNGKPLFQYAIDLAKKSDLFGNIVVSSDDMKILEIAYELGVLAHQRPSTLCGDKVQMKEVVRFLADIYDLGRCACLLTPCNPFVTIDDLKTGYKLFKDSDANYVLSMKLTHPHPALARKLVKGFVEPAKLDRSQTYEAMYHADGGFIFFKPDAFLQEFEYGFYGTKCVPYFSTHFSIDIDTQEDLDLARKLMEAK